MTVAVLFAHRKSAYKAIPGLDVWDEDRDARLWPGGSSLIAHPPCRGWGYFHRFAKPEPHELALSPFAVEKVREQGGVIEHPVGSRLWKVEALELPPVGKEDRWGGITIRVNQVDWGHPANKATLLYIAGLSAAGLPPMPPRGTPTHVIESNRANRRANLPHLPYLPKSQREHTPPAFAAWLIEVARRCSPPGPPRPVVRDMVTCQPDLFACQT